jgi:hypothetical protein
VQLRVAADANACHERTALLTLIGLDAWPSIDPASVVLTADAGRVDITGRYLRGVSMHWRAGDKSGSDACHEPQSNPDGSQSCALTIDRDVPADPTAVSLSFVPPHLAVGEDVVAYDGLARPFKLERLVMPPAKVIVLTLIRADAAMDAEADVARLPLNHPESVGSVECVDAYCEIDGHDLVVRNEHGSDENLDIRLNLRPHVFWQGATALEAAPTAVVPVQRCPLTLASSPPLRGVGGQNLVLKVGGRCQKESALRFFVSGSAAHVVSTHVQDDGQYTVLHIDTPPSDEIYVAMQRGSAVVGSFRAKTRSIPAAHVRLEMPGFGAVDFIPSNRDATLVLPQVGSGGTLIPVPIEGVYTVRTDDQGVYHVRGLEGTTGWIALRLAYRDKNLPTALRETNLAEIVDAVERSIHPASIPIALGTQALSDSPLLELMCNKPDGTPQIMPPARPNAVSFLARESCRLIMHRERLSPEDGDQALRVTVTVIGMDGLTRNEATMDQRVILKPGPEPRHMFINGVTAPFDRVIVRVSLMSDDARYAIAPDDKLNAPQVQWAVTMGTSKLRLFATAALPTGLFRVADRGHSGLYGLNAGVLLRLVGLNPDGAQTPIGLEGGVMVVGITGDTTAAPNGQVALVGGLSVSIPIANWGRLSQAAISLHMWAEYEVSRALQTRGGSPWGFIFGPSISLGDVGYNL